MKFSGIDTFLEWFSAAREVPLCPHLSAGPGSSGLAATARAKETLAGVYYAGGSGYQLVCEKNVGLEASLRSLQ